MKISIIGFGNLGRALAAGLIKSGSVQDGDLYICDNSAQSRKLSEDEYKAHSSEDINYIISSSEIIFLTVKGYVFEALSAVINKDNLVGKTVVSFMAGVGFDKIYSLIGNVGLVRAMPSLAIAQCHGVIGYTKAPAVVADIFDKLGCAFETEPENIEKVMAFASCGLGFAAYLVDAFAAAGETMGFTPEISANIAARTFDNAVSRGHFKETVKAVATPGGATEQGILHMDGAGVYNIVAGAVGKAYDKMK